MTDRFENHLGKDAVSDEDWARVLGEAPEKIAGTANSSEHGKDANLGVANGIGKAKGDYVVGHGKPPKEHQFKPGQSGNRKGRPKGSKNMRSIIRSIMDRNITIRENGRTRRVKFPEAFANSLAVKALNGSTRDQMMLLKAMHDYAPDLLQEAELPTSITVKFVKAKDGKPCLDIEDERDNAP